MTTIFLSEHGDAMAQVVHFTLYMAERLYVNIQ